MPTDEANEVQIVSLDDTATKPQRPIEDILIMASNCLMLVVVVIMIMRLVAKQEIRKAEPTQRQKDIFYDLARSAFMGHEWRVRQIAQTEAWRVIEDIREKEEERKQDSMGVEPIAEVGKTKE